MLVLVDLFEFEVIVTPELGVASSHGVGGFQQVVAEIAVAGFNHSGVFGFKFVQTIGKAAISDRFSRKAFQTGKRDHFTLPSASSAAAAA